jgi:hypothetical protein
MAGHWRPFLPTSSLSTNTTTPPLLISAYFTTTSYTIHLTDLSHLWTQTLDRRGIVRRSIDEDTSIDASLDSSQLRLLLQKIEEGLKGGDDVDLTLAVGYAKAEAGAPPLLRSLDINLSMPMPEGLRPLTWTISLAPCAPASFLQHFTIPLLRAQNERLRGLHELVGILKDKDHVIQKLTDKLEATGAELGHVFAGAMGKGGRTLPRRQAEDKVKGLKPFVLNEWHQGIRKSVENEKDIGAVVQGAFTAREEHDRIEAESEVGVKWESWWDRLKDEPLQVSSRKGAAEGTGEEAVEAVVPDEDVEQSRPEDESTEDEGDFAVPGTPPPPRSSQPQKETPSRGQRTRNVLPDDDESIADEDDAFAEPEVVQDSYTRSKAPSKSPEQPKQSQPKKKLGAIGGARRAKTPTPAPEEASATEGEHSPPKKQQKSPPAKKGGLGKLGGKKKADQPAPAEASASAEPAQQEGSSEVPSRPRGKLGHIGKNKKEEKAPSPQEDEKPEETPEEAAHRRREELKRQLEEKAKQPVKKKRRF